jgi:5'(3')-deoxyribonucleotidase
MEVFCLNRNIVEVDIDGVIADIHGALGAQLTDIMEDFVGDHHVHSWDMKELNELDERLRPRILELFGTPEFIGGLNPFVGAFDSLVALVNYAKENGLEVVINTNVFTGCIPAREAWLDRWFEIHGINLKYAVTSVKSKAMMNSLVIIEDNIENIRNSSAPYKFLVRRGHNRLFVQEDFGVCVEGIIVDSFSDAVVHVTKGIKEYWWDLREPKVE